MNKIIKEKIEYKHDKYEKKIKEIKTKKVFD